MPTAMHPWSSAVLLWLCLSSSPASPLTLLDQAAAERKTVRKEEVDQWLIEGGSWLEGSWQASGLTLDGKPLPTEQVAAIFSSHPGVDARVFLRDGQVLLGRLEWQDAAFDSRQLGLVKLRPGSAGSLILRTRPPAMASPAPPPPAAWVMDAPEGRVLALATLPGEPLKCVSLLGGMDLPWQEVESLRALPPAGLEHELRLRDGTRLRAWLRLQGSGLPVASCTAWARSQQQLASLLGTPPSPTTDAPQAGLKLVDGSLITGQMQAEALPWRVEGAELSLPTAALAGLVLMPPPDTAPAPPGPVFTLTTAGKTLAARPVGSHLPWRRGSQSLAVPWHLVQAVPPPGKGPAAAPQQP